MALPNLLAEYVRTGSDAAFRELVATYINFVYSTALRKLATRFGSFANSCHDIRTGVCADNADANTTIATNAVRFISFLLLIRSVAKRVNVLMVRS